MIKLKQSTGLPAALLAIIGAAVLLRLAAAVALGNQVTPLPGIFDQVSYHTLAGRLLDGHGFTFGQAWWPGTPAGEPTAHWSYLYTGLLAGVYALTGTLPLAARLLQALACGLLFPWLTYRIAARVFPGRPAAALLAAAWTAGYIYFIYYAAALMTEAFYVAGILWVVDCAMRIAEGELGRMRPRLWLELGLAIGLTVLLRQVFLVFVPLLFVWLLWALLRPGAGRAAALGRFVRGGLASGAVLALMIVPFTLHNYRQFGQLVLLNTNAGFAFYWANHPIHGDQFVPILTENMPRYEQLLPPELAGLNQAQMDSALLARGLAFVLDDPARYVRLSFSRVPVYFMFWPAASSSTFSNLSRVLSFGLALPFMLAGVWLWLRDSLRSRPGQQQAVSAQAGLLLLLFAVAYSLVHILSWSLIRYRLPVDAVMLVFAGRALAPVWAGVESLIRRRGVQLNAPTTN